MYYVCMVEYGKTYGIGYVNVVIPSEYHSVIITVEKLVFRLRMCSSYDSIWLPMTQ